ncbi:UNVERIFIED_CONTAM: hypothetical protein FKN15_049976 [Acipenser sinensis]
MKKSLPPSSPSRQLISSDILLRLISSLRCGCFTPFDDIVMEALCLVAFFGFLRCSEFSVPSISSFPVINLRFSDLTQVLRNHFVLFIRTSKTDQLHQGRCVQFSKIDSPLCPSSALTKYLTIRNSCLPSDPLFIDSLRIVITRHWFASHLNTLLSRSGLSPQFYSPHSFRIGAATSAAHNGINQHLIKPMGCWSSSAVEAYIRSSPKDIAAAHQSLPFLSSMCAALQSLSYLHGVVLRGAGGPSFGSFCPDWDTVSSCPSEQPTLTSLSSNTTISPGTQSSNPNGPPCLPSMETKPFLSSMCAALQSLSYLHGVVLRGAGGPSFGSRPAARGCCLTQFFEYRHMSSLSYV